MNSSVVYDKVAPIYLPSGCALSPLPPPTLCAHRDFAFPLGHSTVQNISWAVVL